MKISVKISLATIAVLFAALLLAPFLFRNKITTAVQSELNKNLKATVSFGDVHLSLIRNFPNASITINDLKIIGKGPFEKDTLVSFTKFRATVKWWGLVSGKGLDVPSLYLEHPVLHAIISPQGLANWDILAPDLADTATQDTTSSLNIQWDDVRIDNGRVEYTDRQSPMQIMVDHIDLTMKGDLSSRRSDLTIEGAATPFSFQMGTVRWISGAKLSIHSVIDANLKEMIFTMKDSRLQINDLPLTFKGSFAVKGDAYDTDFTFASDKNDFKNILSLIPAMYQTNFATLKTEGQLQFTGYIRGKVQGDTVPNIGAELSIDKGMFQYPDLPQAGKNIRLKATLFYDGTGQDKTYVHIDPFHMEMAGNPFDATLHIQTPETNMQLSGSATGKINFTSLKQVIPLKNLALKGLLDCNMRFAGFMSAIEKEEYEKFEAQGTARLTSFEYTPATGTTSDASGTSDKVAEGTKTPKAAGTTYPVLIPEAQAQFTSRQITLSKLVAKVGSSEIILSGGIQNYFPYVFKDGTLKGSMNFQSAKINLNEWMDASPKEKPKSTEGDKATNPAKAASEAMSVIEIPKNIDFTLRSQIGQLLYDDLIMTNVQGTIVLRNGQALMQGVSLNMLDGTLALNGSYDSRNLKQPKIDLTMDAKNFNILTTLKSFQKTLGKLFPKPENYSGTISAQMEMQSPLDGEMSPILPLLTAKGKVTSNNLAIKDSKLLKAIGTAVKDKESYNNLKLNDLTIPFEAKDNRISVKPFNIKLNPQVNIELSGDQGFDQTLNYTVKVDVPASYLGSDVSKFLGGKQAAAAQTLSLTGDVGGTLSAPKVKLNMEKTFGSAAGILAGQLLNRLSGSKTSTSTASTTQASASQKQPATTSGPANLEGLTPEKAAQAQAILDESSKKAAQIRQEGKDKADKMEADAAGKNVFQKAASKILAAKTRSDAESNAQKTLNAATTQVEQLKTAK